MIKKAFKAIFLCIAVFIIVEGFCMLFPIEYKEEIQKYAAQYGLSPELIAAQIKTESNYSPAIKSEKGAIGLMQLLPETAEWCAKEMGLETYSKSMLYDPETNIKIGCWYLNHLKEEFDGDISFALAAYNAGLNNVRKWQADGIKNEEDIPFDETKGYVNKILRYEKIYKVRYKELGK